MQYLLDTCIFNWIVDHEYSYSLLDLPQGRYLVTHIQRDEINGVRDESRKELLLNMFHVSGSDFVPTGVFVAGVSRVGEAAAGGGEVYEGIYRQLTVLDGRKKKHLSHVKDAIVGATAHARKAGLVTADRNLYDVMRGFLPEDQLVLWEPQIRASC